MSKINLRIALWNANGLANHLLEVESFLKNNYIDIMLISETHGTDRSYFNITGYATIATNHPSNCAYGGAAILIKRSILYEQQESICTDAVQASCIKIKCSNEKIMIAAIYIRPRFALKEADYDTILNKLGIKFIVGGDFNAKHPHWGSRLSSPKGVQLLRSISKNHVAALSGGRPTYWPTDPNKTPDLIDFFLHKGLNKRLFGVENSYDLTSDHSPVILSYCTIQKLNTKPCINYQKFQNNIQRKTFPNSYIGSVQELETAVTNFSSAITDEINNSSFYPVDRGVQCSRAIREMISHKRKVRKRWQETRDPVIKSELNKLTKELKNALKENKNQEFNSRMTSLTADESTDYSLWKEVKKLNSSNFRDTPLKDPSGRWVTDNLEKANLFKNHLTNVFTPFNENNNQDEINEIENFLNIAMPMTRNTKYISPAEVKKQLKNLKNRKSPGIDGITNRSLKLLPMHAISYICTIFNAMLRLGYFPKQWKIGCIIMIPKPGKPPEVVNSYRPISLLNVLSKVFERLLLSRMYLFIDTLLPSHQFGFRACHGTPQQCHRLVEYIKQSFERKEYCSAIFLDISQAFDKVWHSGLLFKLKNIFPYYIYTILKSYLINREFFVRIGDERSSRGIIRSGVPQGSALGPLLYIIYTSDMPVQHDGITATFADDTAFLSSSINKDEASSKLQGQIDKFCHWCRKWNIKINAEKSQHITFTWRKGDCPPVMINGHLVNEEEQVTGPPRVKYLGLTLDRRLTFGPHIKNMRKELNLKRKKLYYILNTKSSLSLENKLLIYKSVLKPVWAYCCPLWGMASDSNLAIIERFQCITLRVCTGDPNYVPNELIRRDLKIPPVREEISRLASYHRDRMTTHCNPLATDCISNSLTSSRLSKKIFCNI